MKEQYVINLHVSLLKHIKSKQHVDNNDSKELALTELHNEVYHTLMVLQAMFDIEIPEKDE